MSIAGAAAAALLLAPSAVATAAPAGDSGGNVADVLVGKWVGSFHGYINGVYGEGREKIIITEARGNAALGTWQYKDVGGTWSAPQPVSFIVSLDEEDNSYEVNGADANGTYDGDITSSGKLILDYAGSMPDIKSLRFVLRKR
ncbi:MAG: hypothetical protein ACKOT0_08985 [bacterium]